MKMNEKPKRQIQHAKGGLYVLKRITKFFIKIHMRDLFIRGFSLFWFFYFKIRNNIKIYGLKNLPKKGPFILAGNHSSAADALILMGVLSGWKNYRFKYIANIRDFKRDNIQRYFHMLYQGHPRRGPGSELVKLMGKWLLQGHIVAIPPEGMYNKGKVMKGYTGIARVYHYANSNLHILDKISTKRNRNKNNNNLRKIPIYIACTIGADKAYPPFPDKNGNYKAQKGGIIARVGKALYLDDIDPSLPEEEKFKKYREQTDYIMNEIARLALQKEGVTDSWILKERKRGLKRTY